MGILIVCIKFMTPEKYYSTFFMKQMCQLSKQRVAAILISKEYISLVVMPSQTQQEDL